MNERRWSKYSYTFKKPVPNSFLGIPVFQTGLEVFEEPLMMQQNVWEAAQTEGSQATEGLVLVLFPQRDKG